MAKLNIRNRNKDKLDKDGKLKPANWEYRFEAAKVDGKRHSISKAGYKTKKDAEVAGTKAMAEYNSTGARFEPSDISYSDFLDSWFEKYVKVNLKYNTQLSYFQFLENHIKPDLGSYRLGSLTPILLQDYINRKSMTGLKHDTMKKIMSVITLSLKYAVVPAGLLQYSPAEYVQLPKSVDSRKVINRTVVSVEDFQRMLDRFEKGNPFRYALLIGFYAGLRISEVYGLTWDDIDFENKTLTVNKQSLKRNYGVDVRTVMAHKGKKEEKSAWYLASTKTSSSVRTIRIGDTLVQELEEYRQMQLDNRKLYDEYYTLIYKKAEPGEAGETIYRLIEVEGAVPVALPEADMIMRKENGQYSSTDSFKYASRVIRNDLGIQFNFHSLRHTHATFLIDSDINPKEVQTRLGHNRIETTLQTYVHNTENMDLEAVDAIEKIMSTTS